MDGFQAFADELEGFAQPFFQCVVEFFVHGLPHFLQLLGIVVLHGLELLFQGRLYSIEALLVGVGEVLQLLDNYAELDAAANSRSH